MVLDDACNFLKINRLHGKILDKDSSIYTDKCRSTIEHRVLAERDRLTYEGYTLPKLLIWSASDNESCSRVIDTFSESFKSLDIARDPSFLDDLAFTLAARRSLLNSRSFAVVNSASQLPHLSTMTSKPTRSQGTRRLGFIFTGQGAQYHRMGDQLLAYPVFKRSMDLSATYLKELGCVWGLLGNCSGILSFCGCF